MVPPPTTPPELVLYTRADCGLCADAREAIDAVLAERRTAGMPVPVLRTVDVGADHDLSAMYGERLPVVTIAGSELDLVISPRRLARLLDRVLDSVTAV
jgi:hypothetical protein